MMKLLAVTAGAGLALLGAACPLSGDDAQRPGGVLVCPADWIEPPEWVRDAWPYRVMPSSGNVAILLEDAAISQRVDGRRARAVSLQLDFALEGGQWGVECWGYGQFYNKRDHQGTLISATGREGRTEMSVLVSFAPDAWVTGGTGEYAIRFTQQGRKLSGEYEGKFSGRFVKGRVFGVALDPAPRVQGHRPRRWEDAGISERDAATFIARALKAGEHSMASYSNHATPHIAAAGLAALKVYGKPGDFPPPYEQQFHIVPDAATEAPPDRFEAAPMAVVDVVKMAQERAAAEEDAARVDDGDGKGPKATTKKAPPASAPSIVPEAFLVAGPFPLSKLQKRDIPGPWDTDTDEDPLAALGGCAKSRPVAGTTVEWRGEKLVFEKATPGKDIASGKLNPSQRMGNRSDAVCYAFTWVKLEQAATLRMGWMRAPSVWLAGRRLRMGDCIALPAGPHPLLIEIRPFGAPLGLMINTSFELIPRAQAEAMAEANAVARRVYEVRRAAWEKNGRPDPDAHRALMYALRGVSRFFNLAVGAAGFVQEGENYTNVALANAAEFALAYEQATGRQHFRALTNAKWLPFYEVARAIWRDPAHRGTINVHKSKTWGVDGDVVYLAGGYGPYAMTNLVRDSSFPILAGFADRAYLPAMLWQAERRGLTVPQNALGSNADVKPQSPGEVMPRVIVDRQKAGFIFRNRYQDANDIVFMAYGKGDELNGCWTLPDAGGFRIAGLGTRWVMHSGRWKWRWLREDENCVLVPEAPRGWYGATPTHFQGQDDGSGAVSFNMDRTYRKTEPYGDAFPFSAPAGWQDSGVRGGRYFAVDYSGKCGAPALIVVADKITGSKCPLTWQMYAQTGPTYKSTEDVGMKQPTGGPVKEVKADADGRGFTFLDAKGATLRGTVVSPDGKVHVGKPRPVYYKNRDINELEHHQRVELASDSGEFLVVITLQEGAPPQVKAEGKGLAEKVTVGERTVRFDGEKIVLE